MMNQILNNKLSASELSKKGCVVLYAKRSGSTSFNSLYQIKHSLKTKKVGHTGTLDSFACGLLVVCVGPLTRLASRITEFNKTYHAIIKFGQETDTLEYTGNVIKETSLPTKEEFEKEFNLFKGELMQEPPLFSAIHVNGKRASDLTRSGKSIEIPKRKINVFSSKIIEYKLTSDNKVLYVNVEFNVSKGTYIRSLARDIGRKCNSSAHLVGLLRTKVGNFDLSNAVGFNLLKEFTIENVLNDIKDSKELKEEVKIQENEFVDKAILMNNELVEQCGFYSLYINDEYKSNFLNGKPQKYFFYKNSSDFLSSTYNYACVFSSENNFLGLIEKIDNKKLKYSFVINS